MKRMKCAPLATLPFSLSLSLLLSSLRVFSAFLFVVARLCHPRWVFFLLLPTHKRMSGSLSWLISKKICVCERNAQPWSEKSTQNAVLVTLIWSFFCPSWELLLWTWNSTLFSRTAFKKVAFGLAAFDLHGAVVNVAAQKK